MVGENIHVLNACSQPRFQTGETIVTKTLQSPGLILKARSEQILQVICVGRLHCFSGSTLASAIHLHRLLPRSGAKDCWGGPLLINHLGH